MMTARYTNNLSEQQNKSIIKITGKYLFMVLAWLSLIKIYQNFGKMVIMPVVSLMIVATSITLFFIKEDRENTVKSGYWFILGYLGFLVIYRIFIQMITPLTTEQMNASLNIAHSSVSGIATSGLLQNVLLIASVFTPIGYIIMCAKKFTIFTVRTTKEDALKRYKGYKQTDRDI